MLTSLLVFALVAPPPRELPFTDGGWKTADPKARVETLGGKAALRLTSAMSTRPDVDLKDGTLEFDLWSTGERAFAYIHFRMKSEKESEAIYFRLHKSRLPDAVQYDPFFQGLGNWQLFHGPESTAAAELPSGRWIRVRLEQLGEKAALFLGDSREPVLAVPRLFRGREGGFIALRSFLGANIKGEVEPPSSFANVVVRPDVVEYDFSKIVEAKVPPLPGLVTKFRLSPAFVAPEGPVRTLSGPSSPPESWPLAKVLPSGLAVIGSQVTVPEKARRVTTVASFRVIAEEAGVKGLRIGFSDEVSVFLNGQILFSGDQCYFFNFPRQEGLIHLDQATVYLPLKKGENEVRLVVSEVFGGWGIMSQFEDPRGLVVEP